MTGILKALLKSESSNGPLPSSQGLYHTDQRFGPGVVSYPDGRKDVGLWLGERLLKLCASVEEGFSLKRFPEYAAYMDPTTTTIQVHVHHSLSQVDRYCSLKQHWFNMIMSLLLLY